MLVRLQTLYPSTESKMVSWPVQAWPVFSPRIRNVPVVVDESWENTCNGRTCLFLRWTWWRWYEEGACSSGEHCRGRGLPWSRASSANDRKPWELSPKGRHHAAAILHLYMCRLSHLCYPRTTGAPCLRTRGGKRHRERQRFVTSLCSLVPYVHFRVWC